MCFDFTLCGWRVSSEIDLREALPWTGAPDAAIDIHVKFGIVPKNLDNKVAGYLIADVGDNGDYLLKFEGVGRYLVKNGNSIIVHNDCNLDTPDLRLLIQTNCLSVIAWQRGYMPFHGSAIKIGNKTIGLLGVSGGGKSTIAMSLVKRGHMFLTEENIVTYENTGDNNKLYVRPTLPDIRLWKDALEELGISNAELLPNREGQEKYHCPIPDSFEPSVQPLSALIVLSQNYTNPEGFVTHKVLKGADGIGRLGKFIQRRAVGGVLGHSNNILMRCANLVSQRRAYTVTSQKGVEHIHEIADTIEQIAADLPEES